MLSKYDSLVRLQSNPDDPDALYCAAEIARSERHFNIALNYYSRLVRQKSDAQLFNAMSEIYLEMNRGAIASIYLKASLDLLGRKKNVEKEKILKHLIDQFLLANPKVIAVRQQLITQPYTKKQLAQRKQFHKFLRSGNTQAAYEMGKQQYEKGRIDPEIQNVWCSVAYRAGATQDGLTAAFVAFAHNPSDWIALINIADILIQLRRVSHALDYAVAAVNLRPDSAVAWLNLGAAWEVMTKPWESARATRKAIELNPKNPAAWTNLGNAYKNSGQLVEALPAYREAVRLDPLNSALWSNLLFGLNYDPAATEIQIAKEHFEFGRIIEQNYPAIDHHDKMENGIPERIRVGFVSADIRSHPVAYFLEPLWINMDRNRFEIISYDNFPTEDTITKRFKEFTNLWRNIAGMKDDEVVQQILDDNIDVLIDMSGHTGRNRLAVFARKPAPVQITWLGHPNTTGLTRIDWRLTDGWLDPHGVEDRYSEQVWRLPIHAAYSPLVKTPNLRNDLAFSVNETPAIKHGYVTFGTCSNLAKLSPGVVNLWSSILKELPTSRLLIESPGLHQQEFRKALEDRFTACGIIPDRLMLINRTPDMQYKRYHEIDIALDPFPYGGGTTTCDLLWMGVPLITLVGERPMSRIGMCFLTAIGHPEWVADSKESYLDKAVALASDIPKLNSLRLGLRKQVENSPMMDGPAYARSFEYALEVMLHKAYGQEYKKLAPEQQYNATQTVEAEVRQTLALAPYDQLLQQGDALMIAGQWQEALRHFDGLRDRIGAEPNALFGAGMSCSNLGDFERAARYMADALLRRLEPKWVPWLAATYERLEFSLPFYVLAFWLHRNHADINGVAPLFERSQKRMAAELEKRGIRIPETILSIDVKAAAATNLNIVSYLKQNNDQQALDAAEDALSMHPYFQPILLNAALAAKRLQQYERAGKWCLVALAIDPLGYGAITNFGNLLVAANSPHDSMLLLEAGAILTRDDPLLWGNLAVAYNAMRIAPWEAEFAARHALSLDDNIATSWVALGKALSRQGRMAESLASLNRAYAIDPKKRNDDLFTLQYAEELEPQEIASAHFRTGQEMEAACADKIKLLDNDLSLNRKLQLGFVTGDLVGHPVAYFMRGLFANIDKLKFSVTVYFTKAVREEDQVSAYFKGLSECWLNVHDLNDDELADQIRKDVIDVLVDLSGHTAHNRLAVFARKPAPVQVTYLGHPNTSGLNTMGWRIVDAFTGPASIENFYTEKLWRMPDAHCVYYPLVGSPEKRFDSAYAVNETPALQNGYVTFGCCNNLAKISPSVVELWSKVLLAIPNSRLLIESPGLHQREFKRSFISRFEKHGVKPERLTLLNRENKYQYLIYHKIDIALDPFPYNGGTTSCDLLWMGVPLVTMPGEAEVSRLGLSFVNAIGHPEWAASSPEEYVLRAVELARDVVRLNEIRLSLRTQVEASPLMDGARFTRNFELALFEMWRLYVQSVQNTQEGEQ